MTAIDSNLRKAAILLRSLDSDTSAVMLAQLSAAEAASLRAAIRDLGAVDPEEAADVVAEFSRTRSTVSVGDQRGVELELSTPHNRRQPDFRTPAVTEPHANSAKRFEFLANAPTSSLVLYLTREHAQTVAVVLAHVAPARAAAVLGALPEKLQADTIERLSALGETDPESVIALERELAAWMATRTEDRGTLARRRETVANILAAADPQTRRGILNKLEVHNAALAEQLGPHGRANEFGNDTPKQAARRYDSKQASDTSERIRARLVSLDRQIAMPVPAAPRPMPLPRIEFDHLVHLDAASLAAVLRDVDANVLAIALVSSDDALVDRICEPMPKQTARAFRRELRRIGPTRLSDVEAAQRAVADAAARHLATRRAVAASRT
jgi:flagellar motor switch protein FliG